MRFNLAWVDSLSELNDSLKEMSHDVFLDVPQSRKKPPNNSYAISELKPIIEKNKNVRYLAISNVESREDIDHFRNPIGGSVTYVPKIETVRAIENIEQISTGLSDEKIMMLDHDDLFTDVYSRGLGPDYFLELVGKLVGFCGNEGITLLRARGVIFSDEL